MNKSRATLILFAFILLVNSSSLPAQTISLKEIITRNIQAAGSQTQLARIKNYAFTARNQRFYLSAEGKMKITVGQNPAISEIILVNGEKVVRNCYNNISQYSELLKASYQVMARLRSGFFTLKNFQDDLQYEGLKKFGLKQHHVLSNHLGSLEIRFYLDPQTFRLKRLVLRGFDAEKGHFEVNHDFGEYQQFDSLYLPASWFVSQVGTRGQLFEISDVKFNLKLPANFFDSLELNIGQVEVKPGLIKGNIVNFNIARNNRLTLDTNITLNYLNQANIQPGSQVTLKIGDTQLAVKFYSARPPREELGPGAIFMMPDIQDKHMIVYILSTKYGHLADILKPLLPLELVAKNEK
jgi:hypothetical protein